MAIEFWHPNEEFRNQVWLSMSHSVATQNKSQWTAFDNSCPAYIFVPLSELVRLRMIDED